MGRKKHKKIRQDTFNAKPKKTFSTPFLTRTNIKDILIILIISFVVWYPSLHIGFVYWDDDKNILENPFVNQFTFNTFWENTIQIFSSTVIGNYNPLTIWTFGLENAIFGIDNPMYWHLNNLLLHFIAIFLVFRIGIMLGLSRFGVIILTLLFAIHPMRVESVAWITERKDVLYGVFFLGAIYQYIRYRDTSEKWRMVIVVVFFVLSLLSKIQAVTLPVVMILIDYLKGDNIRFRSIINKWPFFLLSLTTGLLGLYMLKQEGSLASSETFPLWQRVFIGSYSFVIYLVKAVVPFRLSPLYPYPPSIPWFFYVSGVIAPVYLYTMYKSWKIENRQVFFGLAFFLVNIVFLLQILGAGQGFMADRFTYIAYFGLFYLMAYYIGQWETIFPKSLKYAQASMVALCIVFAWMTWQQTKIWMDSETLWSHVLKYYDRTTLPYHNRGNFYRDRGKAQLALEDYSSAIALDAKQATTFNSRAKLYFTLGKTTDTLMLALNDYNKAVELNPGNGEYLINRGATYARLGNRSKALEDINQGLILKPDQQSGYLNRFVLHYQMQQFSLALEDIERFLQLNPNHADMWYEKGNINMILGRINNDVISSLDRAIYINPNKAAYHYKRSEALAAMNRMEEARISLENARRLGHQNISPELMKRLGY